MNDIVIFKMMMIMILMVSRTLIIPQISTNDNPILTPLLEALTNIEDFESKFDMTNSALKVRAAI